MRELENIEQELADLRSRFKQALEVLEGLAEVQAQFQDLSQTHLKLKEYVEIAAATLAEVDQAQSRMNQHFLELEKGVDARGDKFRQELLEVRNELENADRNLSEKLARQMSYLSEGNQFDARHVERLERLEAHMYGAESYIRKLDRRLRTIRDILISVLIGFPVIGLALWLLFTRV